MAQGQATPSSLVRPLDSQKSKAATDQTGRWRYRPKNHFLLTIQSAKRPKRDFKLKRAEPAVQPCPSHDVTGIRSEDAWKPLGNRGAGRRPRAASFPGRLSHTVLLPFLEVTSGLRPPALHSPARPIANTFSHSPFLPRLARRK